MRLADYDSVYFIGVGGIGMSALARWFKQRNYYVAGYDRTSTILTNRLEAEGIQIHFEDEVNHIPTRIMSNREKTLVVVTPAIPQGHQGYNYLRSTGFTIRKRAEVLGLISGAFSTVAVAGTHGKTTTSSMIAHLLKHAGCDMTAFLGGIATNYDSNFISSDTDGEDTIAVVEADEFDRSFLTLNPDVAVVTSADADHLDIYGDQQHLEESFKEFIKRIKAHGKLFINEKIASDIVENNLNLTVNTYGIDRGQFFASNITTSSGFFGFDYCDEQYNIKQLKLGVPGFHNVENATVAIAVALDLGVTPEQVREGLAAYKGVKRRFEYILLEKDLVFIDDYAHHPVEIEAFIGSVKKMYGDRKFTVVFQPHLYSRTRDFAEEFARSLSLADEVILLDIYPAREAPMEGITSALIYDSIDAEKTMCTKADLPGIITAGDYEVIATVGAGDIDKMVQPIKQLLLEKL